LSIPTFEELMLPVLEQLASSGELLVPEIRDRVASVKDVSTNDRNQYLPSGSVRTYDNRIGWAIKYLKAAELIESPSRSVYRITESGRRLMLERPAKLDRKFLLTHFTAAKKWAETVQEGSNATGSAKTRTAATSPSSSDASSQTPVETLEAVTLSLRNDLTQKLIEQIQHNSPGFFEELVIDLTVALGYGKSRAEATKHLGRSGDGGVDGVVYEDRLGLSRVYLQAKRYAVGNDVDVDTVRAFSGSLDAERSEKGIFITTSRFTKPAREFATKSQKNIRLIDGAELADLMIDSGVGVVPDKTYAIKKVDLDYFDESNDT
jgi:restriction system protein